jgi:hypothetical protein
MLTMGGQGISPRQGDQAPQGVNLSRFLLKFAKRVAPDAKINFRVLNRFFFFGF